MASTNPERDAQLAAALDADVGVEHVADVYAEAFLDVAQNAGRAAELIEEFDSFLADVLDPIPQLEHVLVSGLVSPEEKIHILERTVGGRASPEFLNFLKVVTRHGRLDVLRAIHRRTGALQESKLGRVRVLVTTATPLAGDQAARIAKSLRPMLKGEPVLEERVDPRVIGGIVVRVGDTVYDGSVANQLENLRQQIIDRSAHEIQSRRDRFRSPAGD